VVAGSSARADAQDWDATSIERPAAPMTSGDLRVSASRGAVCGSNVGGSATVALGYLPQSMNATAHAHWSVVRRAKQQLQRDLELVLLGAPGLPRPVPAGRVEVTATLLVPDRRRRDEGNFRTPLEKALGDALVNGRWIVDDTPAHYRFGEAVFEVVRGVRATRLHISWGDAAQLASGRSHGAGGAS